MNFSRSEKSSFFILCITYFFDMRLLYRLSRSNRTARYIRNITQTDESRDHRISGNNATQGPRDETKTMGESGRAETSGGPANRKFKFRETRARASASARERSPSSALFPARLLSIYILPLFRSLLRRHRRRSARLEKAPILSARLLLRVPDLNFRTRRGLARVLS